MFWKCTQAVNAWLFGCMHEPMRELVGIALAPPSKLLAHPLPPESPIAHATFTTHSKLDYDISFKSVMEEKEGLKEAQAEARREAKEVAALDKELKNEVAEVEAETGVELDDTHDTSGTSGIRFVPAETSDDEVTAALGTESSKPENIYIG